jgi:signal transduction histidine kinase
MSDAILAIAAELSIDAVLKKIVDFARRLADARYAALGVPDNRGAFAEFITSGMSARQWDAIGPLPRTHSLLGAMLHSREPFMTRNIQQDSRFEGWPDHHPHMKSFQGGPIVSKDEVIGAFYLTDNLDGSGFTQADRHLIEILGAHAAVAIENARLYERSRELSIIEERNRLAREIHDTLAQGLAAITLQLETAEALMDTDADAGRIRHSVSWALALAQDNLEEARLSVLDRRAAPLEGRTLVEALTALGKDSAADGGPPVDFETTGEPRPLPPRIEMGLYRIAQEALTNVVKHAWARQVAMQLVTTPNYVQLFIEDDGRGFDPSEVSHDAYGLIGLNERAEVLGGTLRLESGDGVGLASILLHAGVSSLEVQSEELEDQVMYAEPFRVSEATA